MSELKIDEIGLRVGLEIHQQLATTKKLFCNCNPTEAEEFTSKFSRKLRLSKSELGEYDPAALFEKTKSQTIVYYTNPTSSCLVEQDEEPPHELNQDAKKIALLIACSLNSNIFNEFHVMRKMVIDGSNTSGFQRTMLVSQGGNLNVNGRRIGVQTVCLEEDAAKLLGDKETVREFSLDRLGIPLVEIALEPVTASPSEMRRIALTLGRLLRATKKVTRGLGSIRQDVNVSIRDGEVVEIKGVQQLDQLEKVIEYEAKRQDGLLIISNKIKNLKFEKISKEKDIFDVAQLFNHCKSKIMQQALKGNSVIKAIRIKNFAGLFSYSPYEGIRLGKELAQIVRFFGMGGIFHSDELPNYGIKNSEIEKVKKLLQLEQNDGFIIIAGEKRKMKYAIDALIKRIDEAKHGVPSETRMAIRSGETIYLRPRPGSSRMYPETDIPTVIVTKDEINFARKNVPRSWDESLREIQEKYQLNVQLAEQIFDSPYLDLFEKICENKKNSPTFVAAILCSTITSLERQGYDFTLLKDKEIIKALQLFAQEKKKESIEIIFESIMSGKTTTVEETIEKAELKPMNREELTELCHRVIQNNVDIINDQGPRSIGPLMGIVMKKARGRASGEMINKLLKNKIQNYLNSKNKD